MSKFQGTLQREDLGPGVFVLRTDDGQTLMLDGDVPAALVGQRVVVEGAKAKGFGFGMMGGATVQVSSIRAA